MKPYMTLAAMGLAFLAAGCGSKEKSGEAAGASGKSQEEVRQEAAKLDKPRPGQYAQTSEVKQIDVPGLPKQMADQMKSTLQKSQVSNFCLTSAEAEKGYRDMFHDVGQGRECTYSRFDVDGGKLDAQMECASKEGGKAVLTLDGTVAEDKSDITVKMDMSDGPQMGSQPGGQMKMTMHVTTKRIGDCQG